MNDDWRLRVDVHEDGIVHTLAEQLAASELEHDLESTFADSVIVSLERSELFCYAATREQAERAERLIRSVAQERGWTVDTELTHWHPTAERWEEPDRPLPETDAQRAAERAELMAQEREESRAQVYPQYEVRVTCPSREQATTLVQRFRGEGLPSVQRANFLLIGALDEDAANALAERVRSEAPPDSQVTVEASAGTILAESGGNPFAVFGGLAG
jgi:hypothetical protein